MSQITVVQDPQLQFSDIVVALTNSSPEESGEDYRDNQPQVQQTSIYGIEAPLIAINNTVIDFTDVYDFTLECTGSLPTVTMVVHDRYQLIGSLDTPRADNELRIQILPKFEDAYKKINLTFFISNIRVNGDNITVNGTYKVPEFLISNFKAIGQKSTYDLFQQAVNETKLGLASNIEANDEDKRYIYMDNKSWFELLSREIGFAKAENQILDWWIDWWNYLNLVDVMERYKTIDPDDELMIWVAGQKSDLDEGHEYTPMQVPAILNNHPSNKNTELYVKDFTLVNKTGSSISKGTDKVFGVYEMVKEEYMDHLIQDGDVQKDIFVRTEYLGETYGDYNYLLSRELRDAYLQKIQATGMEVELHTPLLALMRGHKVNVVKYINNSMWSMKMDVFKEEGMVNEAESNIPLNDDTTEEIERADSENGKYEIDKAVSGQYLITGCRMKYSDGEWHYIINLARPADQTPKILADEE